MSLANVLVLPDWKHADTSHWFDCWTLAQGYPRLEQHDWQRPLRGDWMARLEEVLRARDEPAVLLAHGLGCMLVAAWAAHSQATHRVSAAALVEPLDVEREDLRAVLHGWAPIVLRTLPFKSLVLGSADPALCSAERVRQFASGWGAVLQAPDGSRAGQAQQVLQQWMVQAGVQNQEGAR